MKIRGERKYKHALELIEKISGEELQLRRLEGEPVDYRLPVMTQDEMVEAGYMKMMVGAIPTTPEEPAEAAEVSEAAEAAETVETAETAGTAEEPAAEQSAPESNSGAAG